MIILMEQRFFFAVYDGNWKKFYLKTLYEFFLIFLPGTETNI